MKKIIIRSITMLAAVLLVVGINAETVEAKKKCAVSGCDSTTWCKSSYCSVHTCHASGCTNRKLGSSNYCSDHQLNKTSKSSSSSSSKKSSYSSSSSSKKSSSSSYKKNSNKHSSTNSYDKGYEDIWLDDDYDEDRYDWDDDYASGVDDAMEDWDW